MHKDKPIVEHPFGTMKRQWGFDHIMTKKSIKRASADVGFIFIAYNLKRIMNIIGLEKLIYLFTLFLSVFSIIALKNNLKRLSYLLNIAKYNFAKNRNILISNKNYYYF